MPIKETGHWRAFTILRLIGHKLFGRYPFINLPLFPLKTRLSITSDRVYLWSVNLKSKRCCCVHNTCWDEDKDWNTGNLVLLCIFHTLEKFTTSVDQFVFFWLVSMISIETLWLMQKRTSNPKASQLLFQTVMVCLERWSMAYPTSCHNTQFSLVFSSGTETAVF